MYLIDLDNVETQLARLIESALEGEEVVITQADRPVLKLVRVPETQPRRQAGSAKGLIQMADDFDEPLEDFREYM